MIPGCRGLHILLVFFLSFFGLNAIAQPTLPDFTGNEDKGVIVLSWNCQYSGIKSIAVLRSADGLSKYTVIGYVENVEKGLQVFVDGHPEPGKNCYKLGIVFLSGVKWSSNSYCRNVEKIQLQISSTLPSNDSIQKLIVTQNIPKPIQPAPPESAKKQASSPPEAPEKVSVSFGDDIAHSTAKTPLQNDIQALPRKKIILSFEEPDEKSATLVKSRYVCTDAVTGHVIIDLPGDVATHHYSVKFYDSKNELLTEIPRINSSKIIVDKRNFQRKGIYKFKLHRDVVELETGYIMILP